MVCGFDCDLLVCFTGLIDFSLLGFVYCCLLAILRLLLLFVRLDLLLGILFGVVYADLLDCFVIVV